MKQEDKELLLKVLCARLPYGVICNTPKGDGHLCSINQTIFGTEYGINVYPVKRDYFSDSEQEEQIIKPYLRPMSSMTDEERNTLIDLCSMFQGGYETDYESYGVSIIETHPVYGVKFYYDFAALDWLNAHHFDYRGLIEKGLALEAQ